MGTFLLFDDFDIDAFTLTFVATLDDKGFEPTNVVFWTGFWGIDLFIVKVNST